MSEPIENPEADIVVVDDDSLVLELVRRLLRGTRYALRLFNDEAEALEYLQRHSANVLIVDYRMPRINGLDLLAALAQDGKLLAKNVFLCSAAELPDSVRDAARRLGVTAMSKDLFSNRNAFLASLDNCTGQPIHATQNEY